MLVLGRREGEQIVLAHPDGTEIVLTVCHRDWRKNYVRIGIDAPREWNISRREPENHDVRP